ncbi:hypothetical protein Lal_00012561 [Lupinus albus]|nr:hypothetical protein Lal_00012561 [Lupinus albus]
MCLGFSFNAVSSGSRLSEPFLTQARKSRLFSKLKSDPLAQARILQPRQVQNITFIAQDFTLPNEHFSLKRANPRSDENPPGVTQPTVERLYFHIPGEHHVHFNDNAEIDNILSRPTVS